MHLLCYSVFFVNSTATTESDTYSHTLALHDALPIYFHPGFRQQPLAARDAMFAQEFTELRIIARGGVHDRTTDHRAVCIEFGGQAGDRKSTRLNSSH